MTLFETPDDYRLVLDALAEVKAGVPIDIFAFCIMPNHWHFAVRPRQDGDLGKFFGKFTQKVTQRWHSLHGSIGSGHLFQGRFKSFLVQKDAYFSQLMQYIEANPLRAKLVPTAEQWQWSSLHLRIHDERSVKKLLAPWVIEPPHDYLIQVDQALSEKQLRQIRSSVVKGAPFGNDRWVTDQVAAHDLSYTARSAGRPKKS